MACVVLERRIGVQFFKPGNSWGRFGLSELPVELPVEFPAELPVEFRAELPVEFPAELPVELLIDVGEGQNTKRSRATSCSRSLC